MAKIILYKMTHDTGFAPNPDHGFMTLATCVPHIRRSLNTNVGDWLGGIVSLTLAEKLGKPEQAGRLVYLMCISEKMPMMDYAKDARFSIKKPTVTYLTGDNIYTFQETAQRAYSITQSSPFHKSWQAMYHDLGGRNVLVSDDFYYFGKDPLEVPITLKEDQCWLYIENLEASRLLEFVQKNGAKIHNKPNKPLEDLTLHNGMSCCCFTCNGECADDCGC